MGDTGGGGGRGGGRGGGTSIAVPTASTGASNTAFAEALTSAVKMLGVPTKVTLTARGQTRTGHIVQNKIGGRIRISLPTRGNNHSRDVYSVGTRGKGRGVLRFEQRLSTKQLKQSGYTAESGYFNRKAGSSNVRWIRG